MPAIDEPVPFAFHDLHRRCIACVLGRIREYYGARLVSLAVFGSYAHGTPRSDSDLDLFIVLESGTWSRFTERNEEFDAAVERPCDPHLQALFEEGISMDLSPVILLREEARSFMPLYLDMADHCLIVRDRGGFLANVLEEIRRRKAHWGSRRSVAGGHWLWEIRPGLKWNEVLRYDE